MTEDSRFVATTSYTGSAFGHEYSVTAKHTPWKTTVTNIDIDGVEYPISRRSSAGTEDEPEVAVRSSGWLKTRLKVHRRTEIGSMPPREEIHVTSAAMGGAGEVEVRKDLDVVPLLPEAGSRSEARERRRAAYPERYALVSGLTTLVRLLLPLLGLGALLAWLLDPIARWMKNHLWPWFEPIAHWLQSVLAPVGEFFEWLFNLLFGWIPDISLGVPDWVTTTLRIGLLVLLAYFASRSNLKRRQKKIEEARMPESAGSSEPE
ncbi:hypothetical protein SAMN04489752_1822 [Brevibacterium siliguriense]|uniref:Uncharacterized protein n=1 Tax=Brevibacterium siliguriense TaxID=1136497 RepID=A0A1H1SLC0_9MICO|nr:hypothetical protein [Brevibacterium siliguriense]SDS48820.1 hypothetical protein SAMN04489752_1822 [Brevibacterium siliguriense]